MEEFKKKGYYPAGGRSQTSSAGSITYKNNSTYPFTNAGNVQDAIDNIYDIIEGTAFDFDTNTSTDYIKENPEGTQKKAKVVMIDGRSLVLNQLVQNGNFAIEDNWTYINGTGTVSNNVATLTSNGEGNLYMASFIAKSSPVSVGHKYYTCVTVATSVTNYLRIALDRSTWSNNFAQFEPTIGTKTYSAIITPTVEAIGVRFGVNSPNEGNTFELQNIMVIDLTQMFGAGNEPSDVADVEAIIGTDYIAYNTGEIIDAPLQEIVSKDSSDVVIDNYVIPDDVKDLPLYGAGLPSALNTLSISDKEYIQRVDSRPYESGDEDDPDVITDGTTTYYELNTPVVADLSDIITEDYIEVADGGTLEFVNNEDYNIPVQNTEIYMVKL